MSNDTGSKGVKRRDFLKVLGTAGATVTTVGCSTDKVQKLIPYLVHPDQTVSGVSTYYATTCRECAAGCGIIAETRDGRTNKLEGNPAHPLNRGALCARGQSALQGLYNPDRFRGPMVKENGTWKPIEWDAALTLVSQKLGDARSRSVAGNGVFLNQHETGSFPGFLDAWLAGFGMRPHVSVDFEADSAVIEYNGPVIKNRFFKPCPETTKNSKIFFLPFPRRARLNYSAVIENSKMGFLHKRAICISIDR